MTEHKYPAVLLPAEVESIEHATNSHRAVLVQAYVAAREWQRQCEQMSASLNAERADHGRTKRALSAAVDEAERANVRADAAERAMRGEG